MSQPEKNGSLDAIIKAINTSDVAAFCIVDYWTMDGYDELSSYSVNEGTKLEKTVFPGIELRVEAPCDYRLNVQVLLSDKLTRQQRADFKSFLKLSNGRPVSDEALIDFARSLSTDKAKEHGFNDGYMENPLQLLQLGSKTAEVSRESLIKAKKALPEGSCLIILPYDTSDGIAGLDWKQHPSADQYFMQLADIFETRSQANIDLFLGRRTDANKSFIDNFIKTMGGKPKPVISGSDAHKLSDYGNFPNNRITWIKADPTFEGLRKVLIEPEGRIYIGEEPEQLIALETRSTKYISSIAIRKATGSNLNEHWFDCDIPVNPGLVAIIGNKGNGKSALGETIGLLGKTANSKHFSFLSTQRFRQSKHNKASHFQAHLKWASGHNESAMLHEDPDPNAYELIKYIPQSYLESLCNELGSGEEGEFDKELRSVIFTHVPESDRLGHTSLESLIEYQTAQATAKIRILQEELAAVISRIVLLEHQGAVEYKTRIQGLLKAKNEELSSLDSNAPSLVEKPSEDENTIQKSQDLSRRLAQMKNDLERSNEKLATCHREFSGVKLRVASCNLLLAKIDNFQRQVDAFLVDIGADLQLLNLTQDDVIKLELSKQPVNTKRSSLLDDQSRLAKDLDSEEAGSIAFEAQRLSIELKAIQEELDAPRRAYEEYLECHKKWQQSRMQIIGDKASPDSIEYLKEELQKIDAIPAELKTERLRAIEKSKEIFQEKLLLCNTCTDLHAPVQRFIDASSIASDQLQLRFDVQISDVGFLDTFFTIVSQGVKGTYCGTEDGRKRLHSLLTESDWSSREEVGQFLQKLIDSLLTDKRDNKPTKVNDIIRKGQTSRALYEFIFGLDYLRPRYSIGVSGKGLKELSPGERGALLLVFYLLVDQSVCPIVIDQPEENLDNQTIYKLLVPCIKQAKKRRQIILITHNPNLAVVCDAEQIIACSIDKQGGNRITYTSGAIENPRINQFILDILEGTRPAFENRGSKYLDAPGRTR
jgi:ABC-type lipoprotein export system ATPase subunit